MKKNTLDILIYLSGAIGLIIQFMDFISSWCKIFIVVIYSLLVLIAMLTENISVSKAKRITKACQFIMNAKNEIVFYGGNLSWVDDYKKVIEEKIKIECVVKVYYDQKQLSPNATESMQKRIEELQKIGCRVYKLPDIYELSCIISDPDNKSDSFSVMIIRKVSSKLDPKNNKYKIFYSNNKDMNESIGVLIKKINRLFSESIKEEQPN